MVGTTCEIKFVLAAVSVWKLLEYLLFLSLDQSICIVWSFLIDLSAVLFFIKNSDQICQNSGKYEMFDWST